VRTVLLFGGTTKFRAAQCTTLFRLTDLEWKVLYVGSSAGPDYDQELDSVLVGPVPIGTSRFVLQTDCPNPARIPDEDLLGATVVMVCVGIKAAFFTVSLSLPA
jgi:hypothetical protein